ncbi:MAG TPA: hypothetical protein VGN20_06495 [Mucilaginibacter sp.]|jgi:hypothetical protein
MKTPIKPLIPTGATNIHVFSIKKDEAFIGYTLPNGNFNFIQIPLKIIR